MVTSCWVKGCKNRAGVNKVSFFRFPRRPENKRQMWIDHIIGQESRLTSSEGSDRRLRLGKIQEPSNHDRICSDHFITGKPSNDPLHVDYIPTLKISLSTTEAPNKISSVSRKKQRQSDLALGSGDHHEGEKRKEAAKALLIMTKMSTPRSSSSRKTNPQSKWCKQKASQTAPDASFALATAKISHLEKEIALLQNVNSHLRSQKQTFEDEIKRSRKMAPTPEDPKKRKIDNESGDMKLSDDCSSSSLLFKDFTLKRVLREDPRSKTISLHGTLSKGEHTSASAVVLLERKPFEVSTLEDSLHKARTTETLSNDIYSTHDAFSAGISPDLKATVICPATEKHISKYSEHEPFLVRETSDLYKSVTEPCIAQSKFSIQWVYNILAKKSESERIVVEDPDPELGFVLLPDMKWDRKNSDQLYLVAIVHKHGIKSLRDLNMQHLPLLENIRSKCLAGIKEQFGVPPHQMRVYLHYQPSYYHLHVHFTNLKLDSPPGSDIMRAHLLDDVIDNIKGDPQFYQKATISYVLRDGDELYKWYKDANYFEGDCS